MSTVLALQSQRILARPSPLQVHRVAVRVAVGVLLLAIGFEVFYSITNPLGVVHHWGADYAVYMDGTRRWLSGGDLYRPFTVFYPPIALLVLVPMSYLPAASWWAIPIGTIAYVLVRQCRSDWQRVALLAAVADFALVPLASGNGSLWIAAGIVAGNRWGWPAALIVLKPNLAPWALVGIRRRRFWLVLAALALVSLLMLPMWFDWLHALQGWYSSPAWSQGAPGLASGGEDYLTGLLSPPFALLWFATRAPDGPASSRERGEERARRRGHRNRGDAIQAMTGTSANGTSSRLYRMPRPRVFPRTVR